MKVIKCNNNNKNYRIIRLYADDHSYVLGLLTNIVGKILAFFDHLPTSFDIFYLNKVDEKLTFSDLPPLLNRVCE